MRFGTLKEKSERLQQIDLRLRSTMSDEVIVKANAVLEEMKGTAVEAGTELQLEQDKFLRACSASKATFDEAFEVINSMVSNALRLGLSDNLPN